RCALLLLFFFTTPASTDIYTLSLHDALPISSRHSCTSASKAAFWRCWKAAMLSALSAKKRWYSAKSNSPCSMRICARPSRKASRSEEHTSELQSRENLVCRLLLEKKKQKKTD